VRLTVHGPPAVAPQRLRTLAARLRERIGDYGYGEGETTMEAVVGGLLRERALTIGLAESCTGGLVGHRLTNVPGSSAYVRGGLVAYADSAKIHQLGVRPETLARTGAVSVETASEMAAGARTAFGSDLGLAITGMAGPDGGTPDKPVGTVCLALAAADAAFQRRYQLWGTREWVKLLSSQIALDWVRRYLLGRDPSESGILRR
jgi:nicotinamide-nucleotide amidase